MKKVCLFALAATAFIAGTLNAEVMNWQVGTDVSTGVGTISYDSVKVTAYYGTDDATVLAPVYDGVTATGETKYELPYTATTASTVEFTNWLDTSASAWTGKTSDTMINFYIELINGGNTVGWSNQSFSKSDVESYFASSASAISGNISHAPSGTVTPEPTSGILLLMGGALLALRRKRA